MKRLAEPKEIAKAALFLSTDLASFVTGSALWANGGNAAVKIQGFGVLVANHGKPL
jgi:NAD(P)-dependent dehydrogenase (short-subunit alcohol dehydrogenase family)